MRHSTEHHTESSLITNQLSVVAPFFVLVSTHPNVWTSRFFKARFFDEFDQVVRRAEEEEEERERIKREAHVRDLEQV